jgi:methionyl-tRNA synthetase
MEATDENLSPTVSFEDFLKVDIRVGEIVASEAVPKSDKLLKLSVYLGELGTRTIVASIAKSYHDARSAIGQRCLVVTNLAPRKVMGIESNGMLLAGRLDDLGVVALATCHSAQPGVRIA